MGMVHYMQGLPHLEILRQEVADYPGNKRSPNCLDAFANSFAEEVTKRWVPVAVEEYEQKKSPYELEAMAIEQASSYATRYTHVPVH